MDKDLFEIKYFDTYYFINIINNIIKNPSTHGRGLDGFYGDDKCYYVVENFNKFSVLHKFIYYIIESINYEEIDDVLLDSVVFNNKKLWLEEALGEHKIEFESFNNYLIRLGITKKNIDHETIIMDYYSYLAKIGKYDLLLENLTEEVFFILFSNREFLMNFNKFISGQFTEKDYDEIPLELRKCYTRKACLKRVSIPKWAKRAIYYRDRGRCCFCGKDLTGVINLSSRENFDHIIPLAKNGLNDVTNLQLLCRECNSKKRHYVVRTSSKYEKWYI